MKIDALAQLGTQIARSAASLSFAGEGDFASKLTLGQIIKGRVLRSYEGQRYLVDFGGERRVVDSALPLRPDEVFHGRVIGLGEQVQLHKLPAAAVDDAVQDLPLGASAPDAEPLAALFARYRADASAPQIEAATRVAAKLPEPPLAALGALVLAKLGLPLEPSLIRALHARLAGRDAGDPEPVALRIETRTGAGPVQLDAAVPALAAALEGGLIEPRPPAAGDASGGPGRGPWRDAAQRILNLQNGGTVSHRLGTIPLVVDGRLVELEVALFDEHPDAQASADRPLRHRQIVIALDTAHLGRVEVRARMAGVRMEVQVAAAHSEHTLELSLHSAHLAQQLGALGWQVDGLAYATVAPPAPGGPLHHTVEHLIHPGSVSRLV